MKGRVAAAEPLRRRLVLVPLLAGGPLVLGRDGSRLGRDSQVDVALILRSAAALEGKGGGAVDSVADQAPSQVGRPAEPFLVGPDNAHRVDKLGRALGDVRVLGVNLFDREAVPAAIQVDDPLGTLLIFGLDRVQDRSPVAVRLNGAEELDHRPNGQARLNRG